MTQAPNTRKRPPLFAIVACILCAITFGFICWNSTLSSDAQVTTGDYLFLVLYECISLISYLVVLWLFSRISKFRGTEVIGVLFLTSIIGTIVPYVASCIQIWMTHELDLGWFIRHSAVALLLLNIGMLIFMGFTAAVGFVLTLTFRTATSKAIGS